LQQCDNTCRKQHTRTKSSLAMQQRDFVMAVQVNCRKTTLPMAKPQCVE